MSRIYEAIRGDQKVEEKANEKQDFVRSTRKVRPLARPEMLSPALWALTSRHINPPLSCRCARWPAWK